MAELQSLTGSANNKTSGTAADAVVEYDAAAGFRHIISGLAWSYNTAPAAGRIKVEDGAETLFDLDITADGPGQIHFEPNLRGTTGEAMTITLYSGGAGVTGKLNVLGHYTQKAAA